MSIKPISSVIQSISDALDESAIHALPNANPEATLPDVTDVEARLGEEQLYAQTRRFQVEAALVQQDVQGEAARLIAAHTNYLGLNLDEEGLGRVVAARVVERPELARAVYAQLSESNKVEVAREMVKRLSDDELRQIVWTEDGRKLLYDINRWVANNSLTGDGRAHEAEDRRLRERIGVALTRTDDVTIGTTQQIATAKPTQGGKQTTGARYTVEDLKRLYGKDAVMQPIDEWVNIVARGEGRFETSGDVGDQVGLSVGILQWQQQSGRLGELMQRYKDVATREGRTEEFYATFGGKEKAETLLNTLNGSNPMSVSAASIKPLFAKAGGVDMFQRAQIEAAREEVGGYIRLIAPLLPYRSADGTVSGRVLAAGLIVKNIGGGRNNPRFVTKAINRTISSLYDEVARMNPAINNQLRERLAGVKPNEVNKVTAAFKREIVEQNVSEQKFLERLPENATRTLYSPAKYEKYHRGVENRIREAINLVNQEKRVKLSDF